MWKKGPKFLSEEDRKWSVNQENSDFESEAMLKSELVEGTPVQVYASKNVQEPPFFTGNFKDANLCLMQQEESDVYYKQQESG